MAAERSLLFPRSPVCVRRERRAGCLLEIAIVAWLTHTHRHTHTSSCRSQHQEGTNQSKPTSKCATRVATKSLRSRCKKWATAGGWCRCGCGCGYPFPLAIRCCCCCCNARCSLLDALCFLLAFALVYVLFVLTHTPAHRGGPASAHSATADYIRRYTSSSIFSLFRGWPDGWLADCWSGHITVFSCCHAFMINLVPAIGNPESYIETLTSSSLSRSRVAVPSVRIGSGLGFGLGSQGHSMAMELSV